MILLYTGKIGDGKTHHVVGYEILPALASGRDVYTNIDGLNQRRFGLYLHNPMIFKKLHIFKDHDQIYDYLKLTELSGEFLNIKRRSLIVIDEAQMLWDAREFKQTRKAFLSLLEYSRHFDLDFIFITQNAKRLDGAIVKLCNEIYSIKNLRMFGSGLGSRYRLSVHQQLGAPASSSTLFKFNPEVFRLYRSSLETNTKRKIPMPNFLKYGLSGLAALIIFGIVSFKKSLIPGVISGKPPITSPSHIVRSTDTVTLDSVVYRDSPISRPEGNKSVVPPSTLPSRPQFESPAAQNAINQLISLSSGAAGGVSGINLIDMAEEGEKRPKWQSSRINTLEGKRRALSKDNLSRYNVVFHGW